MDPEARGLFLGLTAEHGRAELTRAVMEGVALACYDAYGVLFEQGARPKSIVMAGGGAASPLWRQIVADIFNLPVRPLTVGQPSAVGALLLAGSGIGLFDPLQAASSWTAYGSTHQPHSSRHDRYRELLSIFRDAYQKHREDFQLLAGLQR
jgi:xylulokinase